MYDKESAQSKSGSNKNVIYSGELQESRFLQGKDIESQMDEEIAASVLEGFA